ncbi:arginine exporter protein [Buttiauxella gaviniae ATCC 51604]|uniref:Arginine exporter protein ArgO n=1 Tax=Buttiauxella gaviniae ATCC 51604 TaxID=1354253 RepID=A0A1B7I226_9ENTR|nr:arginine exporter ArgO [Buttiauxella gaviniae]OAT22193.1 arginine exporter protein [Buttiauxella gaviniae ATCC 51604]
MLSYFFQGLTLGAALILPLGPQNAFVMNQGIRRQYHLMIASLCALSDVLLICGGVFGGSALLMKSPWLLAIVTWGGVAFLLWYGWGALRTAMSSSVALASAEVMKQGRWKIIATVLAVTWLNPHVYLDTFVVLGSLGGQLADEPKRWFALGTVSASILWFYGLALLAAWLAPRLRTAKAQRIINGVVGVVMWVIALQLASDGVRHIASLMAN